jgi:hypothetical protein
MLETASMPHPKRDFYTPHRLIKEDPRPQIIIIGEIEHQSLTMVVG